MSWLTVCHIMCELKLPTNRHAYPLSSQNIRSNENGLTHLTNDTIIVIGGRQHVAYV